MDRVDFESCAGGRIVVNLNGELGQYFRSYKGLRQRDSLSRLLFNLMADALSKMLNVKM